MNKRNKIIYWITTAWLALGILSTGIVQLIRTPQEKELMIHLGFPIYFLLIIGVWKLFGVIAILIPKLPLLKEWTYAGFFFAMTGAVVSHLFMKDAIKELFGPSLLLVLTICYWYFRPAERKLNCV